MDMDLIVDVLVDTAKDTLALIPFLFLTYVAMEALEHSAEGKAESVVRRAGMAGPAVGALLGAIPQCGFSAMAGTLYAGRLITAGTLVAVILSTSDELIPVFVAHGDRMGQLVWIIASKVAIGMVVGFAADAVLRALHRTGDGHPHIRELCERAHCHCGEVDLAEVEATAHACDCTPDHARDARHAHGHAHGHAHEHARPHAHGRGTRIKHILHSALIHTAQVTAFIAAITFVCGLVIEGAGHDVIASALGAQPLLATLLSALVGLIPNCAASVLIAELYLEGALAAGPMLAGLLVSGGLGLLVLFRTNYDLRQNVIITVFVYVVGVVCGLVAGALG